VDATGLSVEVIGFLKETRTKVINALSNQDYPFPLLVNKLKLKRDPSRNPVFQTLFALQKYDQQSEISRLLGIHTENMDTLEMEPYDMPQTGGQVDLSVEFYESKNKFFGYFHYNTDLFKKATIERLSIHYEELLKNLLSDPCQKLTNVQMIPESEKQQLIYDFNNTSIEFPSDKCIHELIELQVAKIPEKTALVFEDKQLSYREMDQLSNQIANYLINCGIKPKDHVGISLDRSFDMLLGMIGVLKAGAAYVPLDSALPNERLSFMAIDSEIKLLLTQEKYSAKFSGNLNKVFIDKHSSEIKNENIDKPLLNYNSENLAYIIYTSGSTGQPKGVMVEHRQVVNFFSGVNEKLQYDEDGCWLALASISFDISIQELLWPLTRGFKVLIQENNLNELMNDNNFSLPRQIINHHATHLICAYSMIRLLSSNNESLNAIRGLKKVLLGGEPLNKSVIESIFNNSQAEIFNVYGPTETTVFSTFTKINKDDKLLTIGKPLANTCIYILDNNLQLVPIGVSGEIYIGGEGVARGYFGKEELTTDTFLNNFLSINTGATRLYKTGDIGRYLHDGNIEFIGRKDSQIKIRGHRIELGEIESRLRQFEDIKECAVITKKWHEEFKLVAFVVAHCDKVIFSDDLNKYLQQFLPAYMIPSSFVFIKELPLTSNQKLDIKYLQNYNLENKIEEFKPPKTLIENKLVEIWEVVLGVENIGINDNFFDLGGDSILAVQVFSKAGQEGIYIQPRHLFQFQTIRELAKSVDGNQKAEEFKSLIPLQTNGNKAPIFFIPGSGGNAMYLKKLSHYMGHNQPFYGMQAIGIDGSRDPLKSIEEIAAHYVNEITELFPEGPYHIAGHSFGAWVAYEMALQLSRQGKKPGFLGLVDMYAPKSIELKEILSLEDDAAWYLKIVDMLNRLFNLNIKFNLDELKDLSADAQLLFMKKKLEAAHLLPENSDPLLIKGLLNIQKSNSRINYQPKEKYNGPISLIRADLEVNNDDCNFSGHFKDDEFLGWRKLSTYEVSVSYTKGDHLSMMREPNVIHLAEIINRLIKEQNN
jgi:amino acid adenylation domain-containing protein